MSPATAPSNANQTDCAIAHASVVARLGTGWLRILAVVVDRDALLVADFRAIGPFHDADVVLTGAIPLRLGGVPEIVGSDYQLTLFDRCGRHRVSMLRLLRIGLSAAVMHATFRRHT